MEVTTGFVPERHGFPFTNRFPGGAVVAALARMGRLEELLGLDVSGQVSSLAALVEDAPFWGTFGLCGGMSWAALDLFHRGSLPVDQTEPPPPPSELFERLVARQADSMDGRHMLERCIRLQLLPDNAPWWFPWARTLGSETQHREWPTLQAALDDGVPESICLIRVKGVENPARHHQVVATGYSTSRTEIRISIYDPNHPRQAPEVRMRPNRRRSVELSQTSGEPLHGFFVQPWSPPVP